MCIHAQIDYILNSFLAQRQQLNGSSCLIEDPMTHHSLLVTVSFMAHATCNHEDGTTLTYPAGVLDSIQGDCPSDAELEVFISKVQEDIRNIVHKIPQICKCTPNYDGPTACKTILHDNLFTAHLAALLALDWTTGLDNWTLISMH